MNIAILAVCTVNLVLTTTVVIVAKVKVDEALAEARRMRDKTNGVIKSISRLEL